MNFFARFPVIVAKHDANESGGGYAVQDNCPIHKGGFLVNGRWNS
jgi:hypothetical protein